MPLWEAQAPDGKTVTLDLDHEPNEQELSSIFEDLGGALVAPPPPPAPRFPTLPERATLADVLRQPPQLLATEPGPIAPFPTTLAPPQEILPPTLPSRDLSAFQRTPVQLPQPVSAEFPNLVLSPYEQAEIAAGRKVPTGMESGTELTTALAGGVGSAIAAVPPTLQTIADIPSRIARGIGMAKGQYADMPAVGEERAAQAEGFGEAMTTPMVSLDLFKAKVEKDDPAWAAAIKEAEAMLVGLPEFFTSPLGIMTAGVGAGGKAAVTLTRYGFAADMLNSMFTQWPQVRDNWDTMTKAEKGQSISQFLGTAAMVGLLTHPEARGTVKDPLGPKRPSTTSEALASTEVLAPDVVSVGPLRFGAERLPIPTELQLAGAGAMIPEVPAPAERPTSQEQIAPVSPVSRAAPAPTTSPLPVSAIRPVVTGDILTSRIGAEPGRMPRLEPLEAAKPKPEAAPATVAEVAPTASELLRMSDADATAAIKGKYTRDYVVRLAREMTPEQLSEAEPLVRNHLQRQAEIKNRFDRGEVSQQEYIDKLLEINKGKALLDVFQYLERELPKPPEAKAPEAKPAEVSTAETPLEKLRREKAEAEENALTPMHRRYRELKKSNPDAVVLMRIGDFYEAFWDDAKALNEVTKAALTKRNNVPMAGVPYHSVANYIAQLEAAGKKVLVDEGTRAKPAAPAVPEEVAAAPAAVVKPTTIDVLARPNPDPIIQRQLIQNAIVSRQRKVKEWLRGPRRETGAVRNMVAEARGQIAELEKAIPQLPELGRAAGIVRSGEMTGKPMAESAVLTELNNRYGIKPGGAVEMVFEPGNREIGWTIPVKGKPTRIILNRAQIATPGNVYWVMTHEGSHWFLMENGEAISKVLGTLRPKELKSIDAHIEKYYNPKDFRVERIAYGVQHLADAWKERSWFTQIVGKVMAFANETLKVKLTRTAAERMAALAVARGIEGAKAARTEVRPAAPAETAARGVRERQEEPPEITQARTMVAEYESGRLSARDYGRYRSAQDMVSRYDAEAVPAGVEGALAGIKPEETLDPAEFARLQSGPNRKPPPTNPPVTVEPGGKPDIEIVRQSKDYHLFNRINSPQWLFYFGRLGASAKAAWESMVLGEFKMRESVRKDIEQFVRAPLKALPRNLRKGGGRAFFDVLDGKRMEDIVSEWQGKPGGQQIIEQAQIVKTRLEEIRTTIRDIKRDSFSRYLNGMNRDTLSDLFRENIDAQADTSGMTKESMATALSLDQFPDNWGIADGSYLPHLFFGQWKVSAKVPGSETPNFITRSQTIQEAKSRIYEAVKSNPSLKESDFTIEQDMVVPADMIRLGDKRFWKLVSQMKEKNIEPDAVRDALRGNIGRKSTKQKWWGSLQQRKGSEGYSKDYDRTMAAYLNGFHRWRILTDVNREVQPLIERTRQEGRRNAADRLDELLNNLWGKPAKSTAEFDAFVRRLPVARDFIKPMALDRWARFATQLAGTLTLRTARFSVVNRLQPLQGLYPLIGEAGIARAKIFQHTAEGRRLLSEAGVDLDPGQYASELASQSARRELLERFSGERGNQELAFLGMYQHGRKLGLSHEAAIEYGKLRGQLMTQFTPLITDTPALFEGPFGRALFQFKRFPVKQVELMANMAANKNIPALARLLSVYGLLGGLSLALRQTWFTSPDDRLRLKRALDKEHGEGASNVIMYGLPGFLGADISGSITLGDEPMGENVYEKAARAVSGPSLSLGVETTRHLATPKRAEETAVEKMETLLRRFPATKPLAEISALLRGDIDLRTPDGEVKLRRKMTDAIAGLGSFRSANEANISLAVNGIMALRKEENRLKNDFYMAEDRDAAMKPIEAFNQMWPEAAITGQDLYNYLAHRQRIAATTAAERVAGRRHIELLPESQRE